MAIIIECPVDFISVNENKVRLIALHVLALIVTQILFPYWIIPLFLSIDFFCRAFNLGKYSLLNIICQKEIQVFFIKQKPIDQAPKRFAAKIGLIFSLSILALYFFNYSYTAILLSVVLAVFAFLEGVMGICAGCYVYTYYAKWLIKK